MPSDHEKQQVEQILAQEFYFLDKGAQSYAFCSEDGRYVLKIFKFKHMKPSRLVKLLPNVSFFTDYKANHLMRKQVALNKLFSGYILASTKLKEESGIIYAHLQHKVTFEKPIVVYNKMGMRFTLNPNKIYFVIQEKALQTELALRQALNAGNIELAKSRLRQIFELYINEYSKGFSDNDLAVLRNTGFVGSRAVHFDMGELSVPSNVGSLKFPIDEFKLIGKELEGWIKTNFPKAHPVLVEEINDVIRQVAYR